MNLDPETENLYRGVAEALNRGEAPSALTMGNLSFALRDHPQWGDIMGTLNQAHQRVSMNNSMASAQAQAAATSAAFQARAAGNMSAAAAAQAQMLGQTQAMMGNDEDTQGGSPTAPQAPPRGFPQALAI